MGDQMSAPYSTESQCTVWSHPLRDHFVYRFYDIEDQLLYIGCTKRPQQRWQEHRGSRRHMTDRVHRIRMVGPFTRTVAREIEAQALSSENPLYGWTPQKRAESQARDRRITARRNELLAAGVDVYEAISRACREVDDVFPDPREGEYSGREYSDREMS